jgi:tRNA-modifying protein YgfZ
MVATTLQVAPRPRSYVSVNGPDAASYLNRMVSNEVEALDVGGSCEALLLTPKARVIATMVVWRRGADDFLLLSEPGSGERIARELLRSRFAAKCEIALEEHRSTVMLGGEPPATDRHELGLPTTDYGVAAVELVDADPPGEAMPIDESELERLRILARTPRLGRELDDRVMPAEAGLEERAISFTKGCYPGQEPVARLHYRGHPNRGLRVLALDGGELPAYDAELSLEGKVVGRVTSAAPDPEHGVVALAFVRREVPEDATLELSGRAARQLTS